MVNLMPKKILLIVEGDKDEKKFLKMLFNKCFKSTEYQFYAYKTNIHILAQELSRHYPDFENEDIDIRLILSSLEKSKDRKRILLDNYTDVYLVFDFDPRHNPTQFPIIKRMLCYFNDSTVQGKLYINYPMMQSYKHFSSLPDLGFAEKQIELCDVTKYKTIVGSESGFTDLNSYDFSVFYSIAVHHLKKLNYILNHSYTIPTADDYLDMDLSELFDHEVALVENSQIIDVINTCIFALCDFAPNKFFQFIRNNKDALYI